MTRHDYYVDLKGREYSLTALSAEERQLVEELRDHASRAADWGEYDTYWLHRVAGIFDSQGLSRQASRQTAVYRIAQDLSSRLAIRLGLARAPDYRDELEELIRTRFKTRRAFCEATGLSEDMLSHVLARRKNLAMDTLTQALERIGYTIQIVPRGANGTLTGSSSLENVPV